MSHNASWKCEGFWYSKYEPARWVLDALQEAYQRGTGSPD